MFSLFFYLYIVHFYLTSPHLLLPTCKCFVLFLPYDHARLYHPLSITYIKTQPWMFLRACEVSRAHAYSLLKRNTIIHIGCLCGRSKFPGQNNDSGLYEWTSHNCLQRLLKNKVVKYGMYFFIRYSCVLH